MHSLINSRFEKRKVDVLFDQAPVAMAASTVAAILTVILFWRTAGQEILFTWSGSYLLIHAVRYYHLYRFRNTDVEARDYSKSLAIHLSGSVLAGLLWAGIAIYLLGTVSFTDGVVVLLLLGGTAAGSVATNIVILPAFFAFILPATLPIIAYLLLQDSSSLNLFGGLASIFVSFISYGAWRLHKLIIESLSYQFDNLQLLQELEQEKNQVTRLYSNLEFDLNKRKKAEEQLKAEKEKAEELAKSLMAISTLDGLTGIANRRHFDTVIAREWNRATRTGTPLSLIMCDIDYFKPYNDHYGHQKGDNCLIRIATLLQEHARRDDDLAARYGGEEFVILLPGTSLKSAQDIAEQMRVAIENTGIPHRYSDTDNIVTASFGVATIVPARELLPRVLLAKADKALYAAKHQGRNRVVVYQPELYTGSGFDEDELSA